MIKLTSVTIGERERQNIAAVLDSGQLVQGPFVETFESMVATAVGTRHAVAVSNGTVALVAALMAHGIGPGDEVLTSPFTFVATLNSILFVGATPRFVDIGDDFNLDASALEEAVTPATRGVLPVHMYGLMADMRQIMPIVRAADLVLVEDAAQALGARSTLAAAGSLGTGCFSFYATKNVTTGEGGVITTDDDEVALGLRTLRNQGQAARYDYVMPGLNLRMTEIQGAIGVAQMERLDAITARRRHNAAALTSGLEGLPGIHLPVEPEDRASAFHQYTIRVTPESGTDRDRLRRDLADRGVEAGVYYPKAVYDYPCFARHPAVGEVHAPIAERVAGEVLSLPVHPDLTDADLERVVESVREALP
jgi:perosamine synthetase